MILSPWWRKEALKVSTEVTNVSVTSSLASPRLGAHENVGGRRGQVILAEQDRVTGLPSWTATFPLESGIITSGNHNRKKN